MIGQPAAVSPAIVTLTAATFDALVIHGSGPIVVEFMAYGCGHCRTLEPVLQQVAGELASRIEFLRVNVALEAELTSRYAIAATPTLVMFLNGREIRRIEGPHLTQASVFAAITQSFPAQAPDR